MVKLGELALGPVPRIAAPMSDREIDTHGELARRHADVVELRIDRFMRHDAEYAAAVCRTVRAWQRPVIATVRSAAEGGAVDLPDAQRLAVFEAVLPEVDAVDVELRAAIRDRVVALARQRRRLAIVSHHDFARTAAADELGRIADAAWAAGADVVKIAAYAASSGDVDRLLALLLAHRARGAIVIAMGEHGVASRVFFPLIGSLLTYGFLDAAGAPGQMPLPELHTALRRYSPEFAAAHGGSPGRG